MRLERWKMGRGGEGRGGRGREVRWERNTIVL